tara:strand:+ start:866 stop:1012 length:147 start_codon:yes stop_codon:yes gene_type:complete
MSNISTWLKEEPLLSGICTWGKKEQDKKKHVRKRENTITKEKTQQKQM